MKQWLRYSATVLIGLLAACQTTPKPSETLFTENNAFKGEIPADAQQVSPEEFRRGIDSGEAILMSSATLTAQKQGRETQYQQDKSLLNSIIDKDPNTKALLEQVAANPTFEGDRPVKLPGGETVVLEGLGTQLEVAARTYQRSQSVDNAWSNYSLNFELLPEDLKSQAPIPDSLKGKSLAEIQAALKQLDDLLEAKPSSLKTARLETGASALRQESTGIRPQAISPGNGIDNNGPCNPTNLVKLYWFPLKNFVSPIKNQASRGTCWAFTAIGALESRERVQNNNPVNLSEQFMVNKVKQDWDASDYTDGYSPVKALETALSKNQVFPSEGGWTYNGATNRPSVKDGDKDSYANSCTGYTGTCSDTAHQSRRVCTTFVFTFCSYAKATFGGPGVASSRTVQVWKNGENFNLNLYRQLLSQGYVLMAHFPVYRGIMDDVKSDGVVSNYSRTKFETVKENGKDVTKEVSGDYGNHLVQIVGFLSNEDLSKFGNTPKIGGGGYFIMKNSWGCFGGDGGYYYVPADYVSTIFNSLTRLDFDTRRSEAWTREQATPGGSEAPKIEIKTNPAQVDLRLEKDLAAFFKVSHPVAKSVTLGVGSSLDGNLYNGPWSTDTNVLFGSELKRTFATPGTRTLTLIAKYGSTTAQASFNVNVINTPPTLSPQLSGDPRQGEDYPITALITDINESDATKLCNNTNWSVDAPDVLSATTGCQVKVKFGTTGARQVRITTQDSEGASASRTLILNVLPPPENPFPRILSAGVYSREIIGSGQFRSCGRPAVGKGATLDLRQIGCKLLVTQPDRQRYYGDVEVENPSGEALTYEWKLFVTRQSGEVLLYSSNTDTFELYPNGNAIDVTDDCRITLKVNAPDPSRSKSQTVWNGRCTYYATRIN